MRSPGDTRSPLTGLGPYLILCGGVSGVRLGLRAASSRSHLHVYQRLGHRPQGASKLTPRLERTPLTALAQGPRITAPPPARAPPGLPGDCHPKEGHWHFSTSCSVKGCSPALPVTNAANGVTAGEGAAPVGHPVEVDPLRVIVVVQDGVLPGGHAVRRDGSPVPEGLVPLPVHLPPAPARSQSLPELAA